MNRFAVLACVGAIGVSCWLVGSLRREKLPPHLLSRAAPARPPYDPQRAHADVAFHAQRVKNDPQGALGWNMLARSYLRRCRETGDLADATRAEQSARRSLAIRARRNAEGYCLLASSLLTQHRFAEASQAAGNALTLEPQNRQALLLRADIGIQKKRLKEAEADLRGLLRQQEEPGALASWAQLMQMTGRRGEALASIRRARRLAEENAGLSHENVAWYRLREGDFLAAMGQCAEAEQAYRDALAIFPRDYRAMLGLARLHADRKDWQAALEWARRSAEIVPSRKAAVLLAEAYAALGDRAAAAQQRRLAEAFRRLEPSASGYP